MKFNKSFFAVLLLSLSTIFLRNSAVATMDIDTDENSIGNSRSYGGEPANVSPLVMLMESGPYYSWSYSFTGILLSDTCAIIRARGIVDTTETPATLLFKTHRTLWIPRPGCDMQHHIRQIYLNDPGYNFPTREHDIALAKVQRPIYFGNKICQGAPVHSQWVSCDAKGPPPMYSDCYFASYGLNMSLGDKPSPLGPEFISPNKVKVKILSEAACEARREAQEPNAEVFYHPKDQVCMSTYDNHSPTCDEDWNGVLFCKYWNSPQQGNGWGTNNNHGQGQGGPGWRINEERANPDPMRSSGGWSQQNNWVIVGHRTYGFGQLYCQYNSAALALKFGSPTYKHLFLDCEFMCSADLPSGYKCKGNPSPALGPVYCIPEKINTS